MSLKTDFLLESEAQNVRSERMALTALLFFFVSVLVFAWVSFSALMQDDVPVLELNISKKLTQEDAVITPQKPDRPAVPKTAKTDQTDDLLAMIADQKGGNGKAGVKNAAVDDRQTEKQAENIPEKEQSEKIVKQEDEAVLERKSEVLFIEKTVEQKVRTPAQQVLEDKLPPPTLVSGPLVKSLPAFKDIKADKSDNLPLEILSPLPELRDKDGLPKVFKNKSITKTPFDTYKRPVVQPLPAKVPMIAILLSGVGMRENATLSAIHALPAEVSLSFSPYTAHLEQSVSEARKAGHETFLDFPMQVGVFPAVDPGPVGMVSGLPERENKRRLHEIMAKNAAFIGLTGTLDETFSKTSPQMGGFIDELRQRNLIYVNNIGDFSISSANVFSPDIIIGDNFYRAAIVAQLEKARQKALKQGYAFIHASVKPIVILEIQKWMKSFERTDEEKELPPEAVFVPVSYLAEHVLHSDK